ncbi:Uncharacterised protein [Klebsiella pneumoniae]|uniref:Uncharacterized protein n=1 Tax=Klebsiella pneumoniae TaxID=573 RepID=A0A447S553_KLEPN|nr:Uncharacterised protein [Klebsiella pneumoniae]
MWLRSNNVSCKNVSAPVKLFLPGRVTSKEAVPCDIAEQERYGAQFICQRCFVCRPRRPMKWCRNPAASKVRYYLIIVSKKNMLKMISIFFYSLQGETPSNISTTAQAVASLTVSKILPGNYRPLNTSIPVCLAFAFRYSKRSMLRPGKSMSMCCNCRKEMVWPSIAWRQKR